jgi:hypothetical protein
MKQITCPHCADTYPDFDVAHVCSKGPYALKLKPNMNERIKALALQAGIQFPNNLVEGVNGPGVVSPKDKLAKFAELIVRECVELVSVNRDLAIEDGWNVDEAMSTAINDIEEHFGVEE